MITILFFDKEYLYKQILKIKSIMSQYLNALKIIDKVIPGGLTPSTGGSTKCREHGCNCVISNGDFDTFKSTNKTCTRCGHFYYNHDLFL